MRSCRTLPRHDRAAWPSRAIAAVPLLPADQRSAHGHFHTIVEALVQLDDFPAFAGTISLVDVPAVRVSAFILSDLTETFARAYLANARDIVTIIAFIHTVDRARRPAKTIAPDSSTPRAIRTALPFSWQASAAIYSVYGTNPPQAESRRPLTTPTRKK